VSARRAAFVPLSPQSVCRAGGDADPEVELPMASSVPGFIIPCRPPLLYVR
jgi:hypothetical protein